jgi:RecA-family ATPase
MSILPVNQLTATSVAWLWPYRLGLGKPAILDGDPGMGKSFIALDLCARLSTGRAWADGSPSPGSGNALILSGEDSATDTLRPRLEQLGADLGRIFVPRPDDANPDGPLLCLPRQLDRLEAYVKETDARLLILDPIMAFLDLSILSASDQSVRRALWPLTDLGERYRCTPFLIRHLNKRSGGRAVYRGGGSIGFLAACRSAWLAARDPTDPGRCVLAQVKNNLAPPQPSLAYAVRPQPKGPATLTWLGECAFSADELLARPPANYHERDRARAFLALFLRDGPRTSREVWAAARKHDLAPRTLRRAKGDLQVRCLRLWLAGQPLSYWLLPGQELPDTLPGAADAVLLDQSLRDLRQQYPPASPLDEMEE